MLGIVDLPVPVTDDGKEIVVPSSRAAWRSWLDSQPDRDHGAWVVFRKRSSALDGPVYDELVEEALCFGWIDGQARRVDDRRQMLWFSPRRRGGFWASSNKERVARMEEEGRMTDRGREVIEAARADGTWALADDVDDLVLHPDLDKALTEEPLAREAYGALTDSQKKQQLWWVYSAKRPATRASRIQQFVRRLLEGD